MPTRQTATRLNRPQSVLTLPLTAIHNLFTASSFYIYTLNNLSNFTFQLINLVLPL